MLTSLGIIIGIMGIVTMTALGKGGRAFVENEIASLGSDMIFVVPVVLTGRPLRPFDQDDVDMIASEVAGIRLATGRVELSTNALFNGEHVETTIEGVGNDYMEIRGIGMEAGRHFTAAEESSGAKVCIIGPTVRDELFRGFPDPVGLQLRVGNIPCHVIGVFASRASTGGSNADLDGWILMPMKSVQRRIIGSDDITAIVIGYDDVYSSESMEDALVGLLSERRNIPEGGELDFDMIDIGQLRELADSTTAQLTILVSGIAAISLVVGGIGIMNIMLVSVSQRKREIGVRLAVGARSRDVQWQFLTEAVLLSCFGGAVGITLAIGLASGLLSLVDVPFEPDPLMYILSFGICVAIGIVFGFAPARRAAQLDPMEVLRQE